MNILLFTKEYNHNKVGKSGGTGVFYRNLALQLRSRNHKVFVFGSSNKVVNFNEDGIEHFFIKHYFKNYKIAELFRSMVGKLKFMEKFQTKFYESENRYLTKKLEKIIQINNLTIDIIETHDWDGTSLYLKELNIPYVVRYHGSWTILKKYFGYNNVPPGKIPCEKKAAENSTNNISISQYSEKINSNTFTLQNPHLIYNGVDYEFFSAQNNAEIIENSIFYVGNLSEEKGADVALEAFALIKKVVPKATLHFIGNENGYRGKVKNNLKKDVIFYGRKESVEIRALISTAQIVIFPSKGENFSLSLLEVLSLEKAVICSAIDSFKEIIIDNENGMIAEDTEDFAAKAILLFNNSPLRSRLGNKGRELIVNRFGLDKQMDETIKYYAKINENS